MLFLSHVELYSQRTGLRRVLRSCNDLVPLHITGTEGEGLLTRGEQPTSV